MDTNMMVKVAFFRELAGVFTGEAARNAQNAKRMESELKTLQDVNKNLVKQKQDIESRLKDSEVKKLKTFGSGLAVGGGATGVGEYYYNKKYNKPKKETILREVVVGPDGKYKKTIQLKTLGQPILGNSQPTHMPLVQGSDNSLVLKHNG